MEEREDKQNISKYVRIISRTTYYFKSRDIQNICKTKCALFAADGGNSNICIFSNSLEHMNSIYGHEDGIRCLASLPNSSILASGSLDKNIKIWDLGNNTLRCTLTLHRGPVSALCYVNRWLLVSGSVDKSLVVWEYVTSLSKYKPIYLLTGHKSVIRGIIRINGEEIISGECGGELRIWNIIEGICTKRIFRIYDHSNILQMKLFREEDININSNTNTNINTNTKINIVVGVCSREQISVWGSDNNWKTPYNTFRSNRYSMNY